MGHQAVAAKCVSKVFETTSFAESLMRSKIKDQEEFRKEYYEDLEATADLPLDC